MALNNHKLNLIKPGSTNRENRIKITVYSGDSDISRCVVCGEPWKYGTVFYDNIYVCEEHQELGEKKINEVLSKMILEEVDNWI